MEFLPSYFELKTTLPILPFQHHFIEESRQTIRSILNGTDPRLILILGPCSIHDPLSAKEFAIRLKDLRDTFSSQFFIIMRVYCEKPRTSCGWKGFLSDPLLDGSDNINLGIQWTRQLLLELASIKIPAATEFLDPLTAFYYDDLISWGSIGARTASSQIHRTLASGLEMPIGFKNGTAGDISAAVNGALTAIQPHTFIRISDNGKPMISRTKGNPDSHIVLRGGEGGPNYDPSSVSQALEKLEQAKLIPSLIIDCAHDNSGKRQELQSLVFQSIIHQFLEGNPNIRGIMLESHLKSGKQILTPNFSNLEYGVSITDSCLDWQSTCRLIQWGAELLNKATQSLDFSFAERHNNAKLLKN
ncbi:MAG: 3-deoxy-7-phosphoheptulonate synthase [Parachlamydiaceae bacterium]